MCLNPQIIEPYRKVDGTISFRFYLSGTELNKLLIDFKSGEVFEPSKLVAASVELSLIHI
mgnify:CR=1 FL=1